MNSSLSLDPTLRNLNACHACEGLTLEAPIEIWNRPGLSRLLARIGTHATFKASLLARLSLFPELQRLQVRTDDDLAIGLLDAWAVLADVITFYQERIAHETYLRTAVERRSLRELARLVGYELRPGVAASTPLAFTLEPGTGAPTVSPIPPGTRVQSIPGPGQTPQTFETVEAIEGRPEWNAIKPRLSQPQDITIGLKKVLLAGLAANLKPSDTMLIVAGPAGTELAVKRVLSSSIDPASNTTTALLEDDPPDPPPLLRLLLPRGVFTSSPLPLTNTQVGATVFGKSWSHANLVAQSRVQHWSLPAFKQNLRLQLFRLLFRVDKAVHVFRQKAALFGHNAPKWSSLPPSQRHGEQIRNQTGQLINVPPVYPTNWDNRTLADEGAGTLDLDTTYSRIVKGSYVVIETPFARAILRVDDVVEVSRSAFTLNAKITRLKFTRLTGNPESSFPLRSTTVHLESEKLPLAELPIVDAISSAPVSLDGVYPELAVGQRVVLTGEPTDLSGVKVSEALTIAEAELIDGYTWLTFKQGPVNTYVRSSVTFNANVALATHGELVQEVLGSGDATQPFQKFVLKQRPLTYLSAKTPAGAASTLEIRVNGLLWSEVPSFLAAGPDDHVYVVRPAEDGSTVIQFGDGRNGARLPTGLENIRARYRKGMGPDGLVDAGQLTLLQSKPLGVRSVNNPAGATGMSDRESLDDARINAPLTVMTLDRIVSLRDYGDFARAFSGVAKAQAIVAWSNVGRRMFVTIAGADGAAIAEGSELYDNLLTAMRAAGDPQVPLRVLTYTPAFFTLAGTVRCAPDFLEATVSAAIDQRLRTAFGFRAREFTQAVARSEVVAAIHSVPGIVAVDLDKFHRVDLPETLETILTAAGPRISGTDDLGAELLTLDGRPLALTIIKAT